VCGGLAGNLVLYEKGWLGHRETVIGTGEGPIWIARWVGTTSGGNGLIAWASDAVRFSLKTLVEAILKHY
jgi:vacuolar protein sorting-associated protein 41